MNLKLIFTLFILSATFCKSNSISIGSRLGWPSVSDITKPIKGYIDDIPDKVANKVINPIKTEIGSISTSTSNKVIEPIKTFFKDTFGGPIEDIKNGFKTFKEYTIDQYKCWDNNIEKLNSFEENLKKNVTFELIMFKDMYEVVVDLIGDNKIIDGFLNTFQLVETFLSSCFPGDTIYGFMQLIFDKLKIPEMMSKINSDWIKYQIKDKIIKAKKLVQIKPSSSLIELPSIPTKCLIEFKNDNTLPGADQYLNAVDYLNNNYGWFLIGRFFMKTHKWTFILIGKFIKLVMKLITFPFRMLDKGLNKLFGKSYRKFKVSATPSTSPRLVNFKNKLTGSLSGVSDGPVGTFAKVFYKVVGHMFEYAMMDANACVLALQSRWQYCQMKDNQDLCLKNKVIEFIG